MPRRQLVAGATSTGRREVAPPAGFLEGPMSAARMYAKDPCPCGGYRCRSCTQIQEV